MKFSGMKILFFLSLFAFAETCSDAGNGKQRDGEENTGKHVLSDRTISSDNLSEDNLVVFNRIIDRAKKENYSKLSIGELIGKIAFDFIDLPYLGYTLESETERCIIHFEGLDCVTFFENALGLARIIKAEKYNYDDLIKEVTYTRYRKGELTDYTSRLHYTADWIYDNVRKGVVKDITKELGGEKLKVNVYYMSKYPKYYSALVANSDYIPVIKKIEREINSRTYYYIPKTKIKSLEKFLKTGDIIALATNIKGMDYSHIGIVYIDDNGDRRLLHASSTKKRVYLDRTISEYISRVKKQTGITVLRAID